MMAALRVRVPKPVLSLYRSPPSNCSTLSLLTRLCSFSSSIDIDCGPGGGVRRKPVKGAEFTNSVSENARTTTDPAVLDDNYGHDLEGYNYDRYREEDKRRTHNTSPPEPIPNRPLRAEKSYCQSEYRSRGGNHGLRSSSGRGFEKSATTANQRSKPVGLRGNNRTGRQTPSTSSDLFLFDKFGNEENTKQQYSPYPRPQSSPPFTGEKQGHDFLEKFKLGYDDKGDRHLPEAASATPLSKQQQQEEEEQEMKAAAEKLTPPQDADEIFKKMKETGLIPNAVAMLDGLCKDGLVQEAMKLFGLMREKGTIPEVVIYTAVVDGFCKAHKLDDAKRIFRKMQSNGISPNAYSYTVLIHGLYRGNRLEDALDFCVEMLEAGHSPNLATFAGLVDGFCREKGLEEARSIIGALMQKGFSFDEKLVREYLDRKGPFLPLVWEAIFGKKSSDRSF